MFFCNQMDMAARINFLELCANVGEQDCKDAFAAGCECFDGEKPHCLRTNQFLDGLGCGDTETKSIALDNYKKGWVKGLGQKADYAVFGKSQRALISMFKGMLIKDYTMSDSEASAEAVLSISQFLKIAKRQNVSISAL